MCWIRDVNVTQVILAHFMMDKPEENRSFNFLISLPDTECEAWKYCEHFLCFLMKCYCSEERRMLQPSCCSAQQWLLCSAHNFVCQLVTKLQPSNQGHLTTNCCSRYVFFSPMDKHLKNVRVTVWTFLGGKMQCCFLTFFLSYVVLQRCKSYLLSDMALCASWTASSIYGRHVTKSVSLQYVCLLNNSTICFFLP